MMIDCNMLLSAIMFYSANVLMVTLYGFFEHGRLIESEFIFGASLVMTLAILSSSYIPDRKKKKRRM